MSRPARAPSEVLAGASPPLPVILDVDTGIDDALALLLALRAQELDVHGITCVAGNHRLPQVVANTLKVLDVAGAGHIPVAGGMDCALVEPARTPMALHGSDGMADLTLPPSTREVAGIHAVELMREIVAASPTPVCIIALAPLTNIAVFLRMYPHLVANLHSITVMGGTLHRAGNTSTAAEFNMRCDPEAAAIVFGAQVPITLYTLDVFMQVGFSRAEIDGFCRAPGAAARMVGGILSHSCAYFQTGSALIGDAGTVATVIRPQLAQTGEYPVTVELAGRWTRGQTVFDRRTVGDMARLAEWATVAPNCIHVVERVDVQGIRALFAEKIGLALQSE